VEHTIMALSRLTSWLPRTGRKPRRSAPTSTRAHLGLESLDHRIVPAAKATAFTGASGLFWSTPTNWSNGIPASGDSVTINAGLLSTVDVAGLSLAKLTFTGGDSLFLNQSLTLDSTLPGVIQSIVSSGVTDNTVIHSAGGGVMNFVGSNPIIEVQGANLLTLSTDLTGNLGAGGILEKSGTGTLKFSADALYTGSTQVIDGALEVDANTTNKGLPAGGTVIIGDSGGGAAALRILGNEQIPDSADVVIGTDGILVLNGFTETVHSVNNFGSISTVGGTLGLNGDLSTGATTSIGTAANPGGLVLGAGNHTITVATGNTLTVAARITGAGGVTKDGGGDLRYENPLGSPNGNAYTGLTAVNDGTLVFKDAAANSAFQGDLLIGNGIGAGGSAVVKLEAGNEIPNTATVIIKSDGKLNLNGSDESVGSLTLWGGAQVDTGNTVGNGLTLLGNITVNNFVPQLVTITGKVTLNTGNHTITVPDNLGGTDLLMNGKIAGAGGFTKVGAGQMEIQGGLNAGDVNTYTGVTQVADGVLLLKHKSTSAVSKNVVVGGGAGGPGSAVLQLGDLSEIANDAAVTVLGDGLFDLNGKTEFIGSLTLAGGQVTAGGSISGLTVLGDVTATPGGAPGSITGVLSLPLGTHTFNMTDGPAGPALTVDAVVTGAGAVTVTGAGTLVLNGANSYTGATTVNGPTLEVNGPQKQSDVTILAGRLAGSGAVGKVGGTSGVIDPIDTLSTNDLTLAGITYAADVNPGGNDILAVTGAVNLTGGSLTLFATPGTTTGQAFTLIANDGADAVVGTFAGLPEGATLTAGGRTFTITYVGGSGNDVVLTDTGAATPPPKAKSPEPYAVGAGAGGAPTARVFSPDGKPLFDVLAFEGTFTGGVRTAVGDVNGDGVPDLIVGSGPGRVAEVRVFDGVSHDQVMTFSPFADFTGGTFVATGDFNGDGFGDVVVTPDEGGGPRVSILSGKDRTVLANFYGIDDPNFRGGARAAVGDVNGDGQPDLVVAAGFGGGPRVAVFDGDTLGTTQTRLVGDFFVFEQTLRNGVYVTTGDLDGDGKDDLIFGGGPGGGPRVFGLSAAEMLKGNQGDSAVVANFFAGNPDNRGGVRVAAVDLDADAKADLVVGDGSGAGSHVTVYHGVDFIHGTAPEAFDADAFPGFTGGVFVG
jgi:autotransporter-associated beta strand protein